MKRFQDSRNLPDDLAEYILENWWSEEEMTLTRRTSVQAFAAHVDLVASSIPVDVPIQARRQSERGSVRGAFARMLGVDLFRWS
jgi:hypothetical protein